MSDFVEVQFPTAISLGAKGGPRFNTGIFTLSSGFERRNQNWERARHRYDVAHGLKTQEDIDALRDFFMERRGARTGFRFKDWADYEAPGAGNAAKEFMTTDGGATTTFQLSKDYGTGGTKYTRPITKPVSGTIVVYSNAVLTTDWTADTATGIVTLGGTLGATTGNVITATFEFDVPVRFESDEMDITITDNGIFEWGQVVLIEDRI